MANEFHNKVNTWNVVSKNLKIMKGEEMKLRKEIIADAFPDAKVGTTKVDLGAGYSLKATIKEKTEIDEAALPAILEKVAKGTFDKTVVYKPKFSATGFKCLPDEAKEILREALITKPATPGLEIVVPKEKK